MCSGREINFGGKRSNLTHVNQTQPNKKYHIKGQFVDQIERALPNVSSVVALTRISCYIYPCPTALIKHCSIDGAGNCAAIRAIEF